MVLYRDVEIVGLVMVRDDKPDRSGGHPQYSERKDILQRQTGERNSQEVPGLTDYACEDE